MIVDHFMSAGAGLGRRLPELLRAGRPVRQPRASARPRNHDGGRLPRAAGEDRAVQGTHGLDLPLVLLVRQRLQLRLPRHARRVGRSGRIQLPRQAASSSRPGFTTWSGDLHGTSVFLRDGDRVFHTYSTYGRGTEQVGGTHYYLDMTALGRQEAWEEPRGRAIHVEDPIRR